MILKFVSLQCLCCNGIRRFGTTPFVRSANKYQWKPQKKIARKEPLKPPQRTTVSESVVFFLGATAATNLVGAALVYFKLKMDASSRRSWVKSIIPDERIRQCWDQFDTASILLVGLTGAALTTYSLRYTRMGFVLYPKLFMGYGHIKGHVPMFMSTLNHDNWLHMLLNLWLLKLCLPEVMDTLEDRDTAGIFTMQVYLLGSLVSAMASYHWRPVRSASLGMSGGALAIFGVMALYNPHLRFDILFTSYSMEARHIYYLLLMSYGLAYLARINYAGRILDDIGGHLGALLFSWIYVKLNLINFFKYLPQKFSFNNQK